MRHPFQPRLINPPDGDPGIYFDTGRRRGALLFDIGDTEGLPPGSLAQVSHLFISHTHMDHFMGFDRLLREILGSTSTLSVYGPAGIIAQIGHRLAAYRWNLVGGFAVSTTVSVTEVRRHHLLCQRFSCRRAFLPDRAPAQTPPKSALMDDGHWQVTAEILDHRTPCLGFRITEHDPINVDTDALARAGYAAGPWLGELKSLAARGPIPESTRVAVTTLSGHTKTLEAEALCRALIRRRRGRAFAYVTDASYTPDNIKKILRLARDADHLFIESPFLSTHEHHAAAKCHLTAHQAGTLAAMAGAADFTIFHFSPRYRGREEQLEAEARQAFSDAARDETGARLRTPPEPVH